MTTKADQIHDRNHENKRERPNFRQTKKLELEEIEVNQGREDSSSVKQNKMQGIENKKNNISKTKILIYESEENVKHKKYETKLFHNVEYII